MVTLVLQVHFSVGKCGKVRSFPSSSLFATVTNWSNFFLITRHQKIPVPRYKSKDYLHFMLCIRRRIILLTAGLQFD